MFASRAASAEPLLVRVRGVLQWAGIYAAMAAILLLPAIWNGFPFIFADTGGYFSRPFEGNLELGRSAFYGTFLAAGIALDFWPNVIIQALLCAWSIGLVLRVEGLERPIIAVAVAAALCIGTSLPWYAGQLMPDVFMPLSVLALYLMAFASAQLRRWEAAMLIAIVAFAIASHMSIFAVMLLLFALFAVVRVMMASGKSSLRPRLRLAAAGIAAGTALALVSNYMIAGAVTFTPGGATFLFARFLQDGFVKTYLDRNCPDPALSLCRYRDALPSQGDDWLWDFGSPLRKLGEWQAFAPEAGRIVIGSLLQEPAAHVRAVAADTFAQLATVATGEGFDAKNNWHAEWKLREYAPQSLQRFYAAAQQHNAIDFRPLNWLQVPLALGATLILPVLIALCWRCGAVAGAALGLSVFGALLANAAVCATFSGVNDRYQSRIVSIGVLAAALACYELLKARGRPAAAPAAVTPAAETSAHMSLRGS